MHEKDENEAALKFPSFPVHKNKSSNWHNQLWNKAPLQGKIVNFQKLVKETLPVCIGIYSVSNKSAYYIQPRA